MSRFDAADYDDDGIPMEMWQQIVSRALGGARGQRALAEFEEALVALPEKKLIEGNLASDEGVCAVGAYVALKEAKREGLDMAESMARLPHDNEDYEYIHETAEAGRSAGLTWAVAYHMAYLNDETFAEANPGERYRLILGWVRRAQGKEPVIA